MGALRRLLYKSMSNNRIGKVLLNSNFNARFSDAEDYWEHRYKNNGTSGPGSYGDTALYKAGIINKFVTENNISSAIEFGCGDGNQLKEFQFPFYRPGCFKNCHRKMSLHF